jgi:hypothetical protein
MSIVAKTPIQTEDGLYPVGSVIDGLSADEEKRLLRKGAAEPVSVEVEIALEMEKASMSEKSPAPAAKKAADKKKPDSKKSEKKPGPKKEADKKASGAKTAADATNTSEKKPESEDKTGGAGELPPGVDPNLMKGSDE